MVDQFGLQHVEILVSGVDRSVDFQRRALGIVDPRLRLREGAGPVEPAFRADEPGAFHVCLGVPDVQAAYVRLEREGIATSAPPAELLPGLWSVYLRDPDGVHVQLLQVAGDPALHHVAFNVADIDRSLDWYRRLLGVAPAYRGAASGELTSRLLEVPDAGYAVALLPVGGIQLELMQWSHARAAHAPRGREDVGAWSLSLAVADLDETKVRLLDAGYEVQATGPSALSIDDPDGVSLRFAAEPGA
jgi:catechol 2,3-dioxygenase-like lactoylglutathione lyase family enzyme